MALEMGEDDHEVVVQEVLAHDVVLEMASVLDGEFHLAVGIHYDHRGDGSEAVVLGSLEMALGTGARAAVRRVALDYGSVDLLHEIPDKRGVEEVVSAGLAGGELHGHLAFRLASEALVYPHEVLRSDILYEVHDRDFVRSPRRSLLSAAAAGTCGTRSQ